MRSICLVVLIALLWTRSTRGQTPLRLTAHAIDSIARSQVDSGFSGVVLVAYGDSVVVRRAYGPAGAGLAPESGFWIASVTKGFTAVAILRLVQDHRLSLGDTLGGLMAGTPADKRGITIQQLLTHTAGLGGSYSGGGLVARPEAVRAILAPPLEHPPGKGYRYSDDDYELLAALVEIVTGRSWQQYIDETLLGPLGLRHTGFWCGRRGVAAPVSGGRQDEPRCQQPGSRQDDWGHRGANGMSSTADDLLRWIRAGPVVLGSAGRAALVRPQVLVRHEGDDDISYGYGVRIYSRGGRVTEVMHSGSGDEGHTGIVRDLPDGTVVIVLSNAGMHGGSTWASYLGQRLAARQ